MFISTLDLFKIGIGPSSSHTIGPMIAANRFIKNITKSRLLSNGTVAAIECQLKGSLAYTGVGHGTDKAIILGLHGYEPQELVSEDIEQLTKRLSSLSNIVLADGATCQFEPASQLIFDKNETLTQHPNGMIFRLVGSDGSALHSETYFSIGGGFIMTDDEIDSVEAPIRMVTSDHIPHPFDTAESMLRMALERDCTIAQMKMANELSLSYFSSISEINNALDKIWRAMKSCVLSGLNTSGILPGGLKVERRASDLFSQLKQNSQQANLNDWLCAYAMAVNEENAAGHSVVTAPTNGAAGVIPAVLYYFVEHENGTLGQVREFLLTAGAIGGLIKHNSSISGAEVGCQGEVGSASAMAAAGLCAVKGGTPNQVENAAEIALEHHLGMTCDPVAGLVQVPCIERNGFGAIKAYTAASLALRGSGEHFMPLDNCIAAMKQTGMEMSHKFKETALGGLAVSLTEC